MADTVENYRGPPDWVKEQRNSWHGVDYMYHGQFDFDTFYRRYAETLLGPDEGVGRVLDAVQHSALAADTLILYMGDTVRQPLRAMGELAAQTLLGRISLQRSTAPASITVGPS